MRLSDFPLGPKPVFALKGSEMESLSYAVFSCRKQVIPVSFVLGSRVQSVHSHGFSRGEVTVSTSPETLR